MKYKILFSKKFLKQLRRFSVQDRRSIFKTIGEIAEEGPHKNKALRTKPIRGKKHRPYESSVNMDIRLIWVYRDSTTISMVEIGHHNIIYDLEDYDY